MLQKLLYKYYRYKYLNAPKLNLKKPVDVALELSSYCTNKCGYCYHADSKNLPFKRGLMSKDLAIKILDEASDIEVHSLKFNLRGESTMNSIYEDVTAYAKSKARGMTFIDRVTNSNFNFKIDREDIFRGLCNQTKVKVSFDSFRKDIFEKQRAGSKYEATLANIDKFYNYPGRDNILVVQSVRTKLNHDEDLEHEIKTRWPSAVSSIRDVVEGRVNKDYSELVVKKRDLDNRTTCIQAHARLIVGYDGTVSMCCPDLTQSLKIGDCNKQTLDQIWNSKVAKKIRQQLLNKEAFKNYDACKNCSSFESYRGFKPAKDS